MKKSKKEAKFNKVSIIPAVAIILLYILYISSIFHAESVAGKSFDKIMEYQALIKTEPGSKEILTKKLLAELEAIPTNKFLAKVAQYGQPAVDLLTPFEPHCLSKKSPCSYYSNTITELRDKYVYNSASPASLPVIFSEQSKQATLMQIIISGIVLALEAFAITMIIMYFAKK